MQRKPNSSFGFYQTSLFSLDSLRNYSQCILIYSSFICFFTTLSSLFDFFLSSHSSLCFCHPLLFLPFSTIFLFFSHNHLSILFFSLSTLSILFFLILSYSDFSFPLSSLSLLSFLLLFLIHHFLFTPLSIFFSLFSHNNFLPHPFLFSSPTTISLPFLTIIYYEPTTRGDNKILLSNCLL